jgi:rare lipoprotein A
VVRKVITALGAAGLICASLMSIGDTKAEVAAQKNPNTAKPTVVKSSVAKPVVPKQAAAAFASAFETGMASVYCFRNGPTASGERSRPAVLTAAHKTLPFGTLVEVTNRENGRSIVVRINDRGPFVAGRVIDLTPAGARALKFDGLTRVTLRVLNNQRDSRIIARAI